MNRTGLLKVTNSLLFISMIAQAITGIVLFFDLFSAKVKLFEMIAEIHKYNGLVVVALVAMHLVLNWSWIRNQFFKRSAA